MARRVVYITLQNAEGTPLTGVEVAARPSLQARHDVLFFADGRIVPATPITKTTDSTGYAEWNLHDNADYTPQHSTGSPLSRKSLSG